MNKIKLYDDLFYLVLHDVVLFTTYDEETGEYNDNYITPFINCGDTFHYATADAEGFKLEHASYLRILYDMFGYDGLVAWISTKRNQSVIDPCNTDLYHNAMMWIKDNPFIKPDNDDSLESLVYQLLKIFETVEESDGGRVFHPTTINSCRSMTIVKLEKILKQMGDRVGLHSKLKIKPVNENEIR
jgi:hypothetical protein